MHTIHEQGWRMRHYVMHQICISSIYVKMIILKLCSIEDADIYYHSVYFCKNDENHHPSQCDSPDDK